MSEKLLVNFTSHSCGYEIEFGDFLKIDFQKKYSRVLLVTSQKVGELYLSLVLPKICHCEVFKCILKDGEEHKNFSSIEEILQKAFEFQLDRKSLMIALGGGAISDMVGFASGIYQRGIDFINIPTTLLAQVDASVGGKTGINTQFGKNLIGIFHQPKKVYISPIFLASLSSREINAGIAEIIKIAVCFDSDFFDFLTKSNLYLQKDLQYAIKKSIELKAKVIEKDEKEEGIRVGLNYGHTFAHAIELETNYVQFLHGEAVAIGMQMANLLALKIGVLKQNEIEKIEELLKKYHLLIQYKIYNQKSFYKSFFLDKKTHYQKVRFVLPNGIGDVLVMDDIKKSFILEVLEVFS
ncbi:MULTISPECIES: 3-dehydroquinate synthase [unclassified Helicobacter]|uniref:3-dehydroquinate synthase n=1 Tax=unclassified Helicobacter TaxID=2593540 RepID=UPI000CF084FC|nr:MULTISPECIES: 3-dehydroquinate synthase [unclassified Helicobacter]